MDRNDLISRSDLKRILSDPLYRSTIKDYGEVLKYTFVMDMIDNAPTIPLPDFKEGGWIYEDRQITIEEYMQSLKGEKMKDVDELDQHLSHKTAYQLDPDLWEEEMKYDARHYLTEQGDKDE